MIGEINTDGTVPVLFFNLRSFESIFLNTDQQEISSIILLNLQQVNLDQRIETIDRLNLRLVLYARTYYDVPCKVVITLYDTRLFRLWY